MAMGAMAKRKSLFQAAIGLLRRSERLILDHKTSRADTGSIPGRAQLHDSMTLHHGLSEAAVPDECAAGGDTARDAPLNCCYRSGRIARRLREGYASTNQLLRTGTRGHGQDCRNFGACATNIASLALCLPCWRGTF
ncbi:Protein of unknown function [Gryllus bimaculatus]|nr:Protein of unknown function [Gryllus bimaculatus]